MPSAIDNLYKDWLKNAKEDSDVTKELTKIENQEDEIYERFYKELEFGTAGLRGIIGAGTNRMNIYTVAKATQGLSNYLKSKYKNPSVAISFDSRIKSSLFAEHCAMVLAANGIKVYITKELQPVPVLSFAVRNLKCKAGIMITASHNPAKYNGYKCYGSDGCQMTDLSADKVYKEIQKVDALKVKKIAFKQGLEKELIRYIDDNLYEDYLKKLSEQTVNKNVCKDSHIKLVYTPLNGAGNKLVRKILTKIGMEDITVVPEQENPDGNFSTCPYPNPEIKEALTLALNLAKEINSDLVLATDPDCDRVGIAVRSGNDFRLMTGNEVGIMLINYILSERDKNKNLPKGAVAVKTVVTSPLADKICQKYGCEMRNVLPGFKYIGEQILSLEKGKQEKRFIFGFEESYGYLSGTYVRDKDGVVASMLICEMAAFYKKQNKTLTDVINSIYKEYGFYKSETLNFNFEGSAGMEKMKQVMDNLRKKPFKNIAGFDVVSARDYEKTESDTSAGIKLPKSNILEYVLENDLKVIIRPSGTEPKIKAYITSVGKNQSQAETISKKLSVFMTHIINN